MTFRCSSHLSADCCPPWCTDRINMPPAAVEVVEHGDGSDKRLTVVAVVQPSRERSERTEMLMDIAAGIAPHADVVEVIEPDPEPAEPEPREDSEPEHDIDIFTLAERAASGMHVSFAAIGELGSALLKLRAHFGDHNILGAIER